MTESQRQRNLEKNSHNSALYANVNLLKVHIQLVFK